MLPPTNVCVIAVRVIFVVINNVNNYCNNN